MYVLSYTMSLFDSFFYSHDFYNELCMPSLSTVEKIMDILGMEVKYEIRQTVQTRRSNFQQNIKEVNIG